MYVPNNVSVFVAAFSGAISGMGVSDRIPTNSVISSYANLASVAGAYAQSFDTAWGVTVPTTLDISSIQEMSESVWAERAPQAVAPFLTPGTFTGLCNALVAVVRAGSAYFTAQGVVPGPVISTAVGGSLAGNLPNPTVVQIDGVAGVLPVLATDINCTGNAKCQPITRISSFLTTDATANQIAFTSPHITAGTWQVNIILTADLNDLINGGGWNRSFFVKATGAGTIAFVGAVPANVAPDDGSAGVAALRSNIVIAADQFELLVTGAGAVNTEFGYFVQAIPAKQ